MVLARLIWPADTIKDKDAKLIARGKLPGNLRGAYSLEAFGYRLGNYKGDYSGSWDEWNPEMHDYMMQDGEVTFSLWKRIADENWPERSVDLEHKVQWIISRQERYGFLFDVDRAGKLYTELTRIKLDLEDKLQRVFPPWVVETPFIPKANNSKLGYIKGVPTSKKKLIVFNPASRDHIADRLKTLRGWRPKDLTPEGKPKVDETTLTGLPWPEAALLVDYLMVEKVTGQLATGKQAWLKKVGRDNRLHGRVISNGALTGRMTHSNPNVAQVPAVSKGKSGDILWGLEGRFGADCRALFVAPKGKRLVGVDASALELRCLAAFMARYDNGDYIRVVLDGKKEDGTEIHSVNAKALGADRDTAKIWFYAFIYGAGDYKLGLILGAKKNHKRLGKESRARFMANLPALGKLVGAVKARVEGGLGARTHLTGLDGRRLTPRGSHSALNTLLQSAGAVIMKEALVLLDTELQAAGLVPGVHYEFVANVHDEWQIEADEAWAEFIRDTAVAAIRRAAGTLNFRCPLDGEGKIGGSWLETH